MKTQRTEQIQLPNKHLIGHWCHMAKNLYNNANYTIRRELRESGNWIRYYELNTLMKNKEEQYNDYRKMPVQSAQQTLKKLDKNWNAFFKATEAWKKDPSKFLGQPRPPKYLKKDGETIIIFTNQQCNIQDGILKFPKAIDLEVKTRLLDNTDLREVRIVPKGTGYVVEIVYQIDIPEQKKESPRRIAGIDLGLVNLVTLTDNIGSNPIVIKGGIPKSINRYFNKHLAQLKSIYDRQGIKTGKQMNRLFLRRNNRIKDYFHKTSRKIVNICKERKIDTIVVGHNKNWKQEVNMGKRTNQNFVQLPYNVLIHHLSYKSEESAMRVVEHNESHTSKCSFLDNEPICHREKYAGRRTKRGMFRSSDGTKINADVNGSLNIIRKVFPEAFADGIVGVGLHPKRLSVV